MVRLATIGYETGSMNAEGQAGGSGTIGSPTFDTTTVRSGSRSLKCASGAQNANVGYTTWSGAINTTYYARAYVRITSLATAQRSIMLLSGTSGHGIVASLSNGDWALCNSGGSQLTGPTFTPSTNTWYRVELSSNANGSGGGTLEFRVDGTTINSFSGAIGDTAGASRLDLGNGSNTGDTYFDDVAVNDSTGTDQNSWPGDGKIVMLFPTSDNGSAAASWTKPGGSTTNRYTSIDNTPPNGVADSTSAAQAENQIRNSSANASYIANLTTYTAAGISGTDVINLVLPVVITAAPVSTQAKVGSIALTNPSITAVALTGNSGQFWSGVAAGTYPTGWKMSYGTLTYSPTPTLGTAPTLTVGITSGTTSRIAIVCFAAAYVDYSPFAAPSYVSFDQVGMMGIFGQ